MILSLKRGCGSEKSFDVSTMYRNRIDSIFLFVVIVSKSILLRYPSLLFISNYRVRRCVSHYYTPLGRFSMLDISPAGKVSMPKRASVGSILSRAFRRRMVRYWHRFGCRAIDLGKPPQGGVMYTLVYGITYFEVFNY